MEYINGYPAFFDRSPGLHIPYSKTYIRRLRCGEDCILCKIGIAKDFEDGHEFPLDDTGRV